MNQGEIEQVKGEVNDRSVSRERGMQMEKLHGGVGLEKWWQEIEGTLLP